MFMLIYPLPCFAFHRSFTWTRSGVYLNVARDPQVTMKRRSGTLEIFFWGRPEDYEGVYQCTATNEFGSALSSHIHLRVSSKSHQHIFIRRCPGIKSNMKLNFIIFLFILFIAHVVSRGSYMAEGIFGASVCVCGSTFDSAM